ncbi:MAG: hypothetical protein ACYTG6_02435 [Planctomycetota bacterium]|jgi:hypothetical protein
MRSLPIRRFTIVLVMSLLWMGRDGAAEEDADLEFLPDLRLPTIDGTQTVSTWELRGRKVLLIQFASW